MNKEKSSSMSSPSVRTKGLSFCFSWHSHEHLFKIKHSWELQKLLSWKRCPKPLFLCFHVKPRSSDTFSFGDWNHSHLLAKSTLTSERSQNVLINTSLKWTRYEKPWYSLFGTFLIQGIYVSYWKKFPSDIPPPRGAICVPAEVSSSKWKLSLK